MRESAKHWEGARPRAAQVGPGLAEVAATIRRAGGAGGLAGHIGTLAGALPRSTTEHAVYNLAAALGLWTSDLADALEGDAVPPTQPSSDSAQGFHTTQPLDMVQPHEPPPQSADGSDHAATGGASCGVRKQP